MFGVALDKKNIGVLLKDFNTLTGTRIAFCSYDFKESIAEPKDISRFCAILRTDKKANKKCLECDRWAFESAAQRKGLYIYECHVGLTEGVAPVIIEDKLLGYLMMGQTLKHTPDEQAWEKVRFNCKDFNVDFLSLKEAFFTLPYIAWEKIYAAARIMELSAKFIHLSNLIKVHVPSMMEKINCYIELNFDKPITISEMSKSLNISKSYLSHIIKQEYKKSLTKYVQGRKIEKAKRLLDETDMSISGISEILGFNDTNYFARTFKQNTGISATQYRMNPKEKAELC